MPQDGLMGDRISCNRPFEINIVVVVVACSSSVTLSISYCRSSNDILTHPLCIVWLLGDDETGHTPLTPEQHRQVSSYTPPERPDLIQQIQGIVFDSNTYI